MQFKNSVVLSEIFESIKSFNEIIIKYLETLRQYYLNFRVLQNSMSKISSQKNKNLALSKIKSHQVLRVASQQSLHSKSIEKSYNRNNYQLQVPLKIKKSLHNNNSRSRSRKQQPLSTHKSKNISSKRASKLDLGINLKKLNNSQYKTVQNIATKLNSQQLNLPSFRQYCIVGSSFIPLDSSDQKRLFSGLMANTVSTCDPQFWRSTSKKQCLNFSDVNDQIQIFVPVKDDKNQCQRNQGHFQSDNDNNFLQLWQKNKDVQSYQSKTITITDKKCDKRQVYQQKPYKKQAQCKSVYCQTELNQQKVKFSKFQDAQTQYSSRKCFDQQKQVRDTDRQVYHGESTGIGIEKNTTSVVQRQNQKLNQKQNDAKSMQLTVQLINKSTNKANQEIKWKLRDSVRCSINLSHSKETNSDSKAQMHDHSSRTSKADPRNNRNQQNFQDVLLKLEFLHLPQKNCFQSMNKQEREHYSSLFRTLLSKLDLAHNQSKSDKIGFDQTNDIADNKQAQDSQNLREERQEIRFIRKTVGQECLEKQNFKQRQSFQSIGSSAGLAAKQNAENQDVHDEELQHQRMRALDIMNFQVELRQIRQLSLALPSNTCSGFTLLGIANELTSLLTFLQLNYTDQTLQVLNRVYGYSYKDRFLSIRNRKAILFNFRKLLPPQIYTHYLQQTISFQQKEQDFQQENRCTYAHALFDCINQELDAYRAFFSSQGQPYPWSMKIIKSITYFTIDQQSIQIVFSQIKEKILGYVSVLCGLLVDNQYDSVVSREQNPIVKKRFQAQLKMAHSWINEIDQTPSLQNSCTQVLLALSDLVFDQLIAQIAHDLLSVTNEQLFANVNNKQAMTNE